ncbi:MAG: hypothetical protein U0271_09540 [Polyangiaceae bacterium]
MQRARLVVATLAFAGALSAVLPSCREVVVGEPVDLTDRVCTLLESCYGTSAFTCTDIRARFEGADDATRAAFLGNFDTQTCFATCPGARACLDAPPFCGVSECQSDTDCCGWSTGTAACLSGYCCRPDGVACGDDALFCCNGLCEDGGCGGYVCADIGATCATDFDCCSQYCVDDVCQIRNCSNPGEPCLGDDDCCTIGGTSLKLTCDPQSSTCVGGDQACIPQGETCFATDVLPCCDGLPCQLGADAQTGVCANSSTCLGPESDCDPMLGNPCCPPYFCSPTTARCQPQTNNCAGPTEPCNGDTDCCTGLQCAGNVCEAPTCNTASCHSPCVTGAPIDLPCPSTPALSTDALDCITKVLGIRPACGCVEWASECVDAARMACGPLCANTN